MRFTALKYSVTGRIARITLNRPARLNAIDDKMPREIRRAVEAANAGLSRVERVKRFAILASEWRAGGDELTPTLKLKRRGIATRYAGEIDELYSPSAGGRSSPGHEPVR